MSTLTFPGGESILARITRERNTLFQQTWLPTVYPDTDFTALPLPYLKDLYKNIWFHGPRGDIYAAQLTGMRGMLDRMLTEPGYRAPFLADTNAFIRMFSPYRYTYRVEIENEAASQYRPLASRDRAYAELADAIVNHPVALPPTISHGGRQVFIDQFTFHSKYRDLLVGTARDVDGHGQAFDSYCQRWGIPT